MHRIILRRPLVAVLAVALFLPAVAFAADPVVPNEPIIPALQRVSWSAVFAGAVVALAIHAALSTLGIGVGAAAIDPHNHDHPAKGVPTAVLVWMFVSGLVALFVGGWVAGRLAGTGPFDSGIHGAIVWSLATVVLLYLATTTAGAVVGGTFRLLGAGVSAAGQVAGGAASAAGHVAGGTVSAAGHVAGGTAAAAGGAVAVLAPETIQKAKDAVADAVPQLDWNGIRREAKKVLHLGNGNGNGGNDEGKGDIDQGSQNGQGKQNDKDKSGDQDGMWGDKEEVIELLTKAYGAIRDGLRNADRDALLSAISERAGVTKEEANKTLEKWEKMYRDAKQEYEVAVAKAEEKARDVAAATTAAVSRIAVWTFASLILGVTLAAIGGNLGSTFTRL